MSQNILDYRKNLSEYNRNIVIFLNQYLADIAVLTIKLYNFHWNIVGDFFYPLHAKYQEYYEETTEMFDEIAELIKQFGGYPIASLKEYSYVSKITEIESKNYNHRETLSELANDFDYIYQLTMQIIGYAGQFDDEITIAILSEYAAFFKKELWMLQASLK
jgi:starvation-inducible DNA-binding protein